jgi:hypothetical protein
MPLPDDSAPRAWMQRHRPILFLTGHGSYLALVFCFPFVMTYMMTPGEFARLMVYVNVVTLLFDGFNFGLARGLQQLAIQTPERRLARALARPLQGAVGMMAFVSLALAALVALAALLRPQWIEHDLWIAFWIWAAVEIGLVRLCISALTYGLRRYGTYIFMDQAWALMRLAFVPLLWWWAGVPGALAALALVWLASALPGLRVLARSSLRPARGSWSAAFGSLQYYLRLGFWMHATSMAGSLVRPASVLLLAAALGRDHPSIGFLHLSLSCFVVGMVMLDSLFLSLYPEKAQAGLAGRRRDLIRWAARESCVLAYLLVPLVWALAWSMPGIVRVLKPDYRDLAAWMTPILLALPARAMAAPLITALQAGHRASLGAAFQFMRLAFDLVGLGAGMMLDHASGSGPVWGILAGEWAATALLVAIHDPGPAHSEARRAAASMLIMLTLVGLWSGALALACGGAAHWNLWLAFAAGWYFLLPWTPLVSARAVIELFTAHGWGTDS